MKNVKDKWKCNGLTYPNRMSTYTQLVRVLEER